VLATARDIESLRDLSERHGDQIKLFALDVTDEPAAASALEAAIGAFGSLEVANHVAVNPQCSSRAAMPK